MKLNSEQLVNLELWAKILSTTKSPQIHGELKTTKGYCCLGIAAECVLHISPVNEELAGLSDCYSFDGEYGILTEKLRKALGLTDRQMSKFISYNDIDHLSFKEIAEKVKELINAHNLLYNTAP